jgi:hypothetical protein
MMSSPVRVRAISNVNISLATVPLMGDDELRPHETLGLQSHTGDDPAPVRGSTLEYSRSFRHLACLAVSLAFIGSASPVWAWGDLGHRVICQIAFQELNNKARSEVIRLIALDGIFDSFTDACTWPDHPRKLAAEHFVNLPSSLATITTTDCHGVPKCLFTAIPADLDVLRTSNDDAAKLASLKYSGIGWGHPPAPPRLIRG